MRAVAIRQHGDVGALERLEVDTPAPGPGDVRVAVASAALNHLDIWVRKGRRGMQLGFPHVLGSDASGTIDAVGAGVPDSIVGSEVCINPGLSLATDESTARGQHSESPAFGILGAGRRGTFAEYVVVPEANVAPKPTGYSWDEAAALPLAYLTAWRMVFTQAQLAPGDLILIHGIGGGVALAALQLASRAGARCIVTSSSDTKLQRARELGAAATINYATVDNVAEAVLVETRSRGVDCVIDAVGAATMATNLECTRPGGRIVHCGVTTGAQVPFDIATLYHKQLTIVGSKMGTPEEFRRLLAYVETPGIRPVIDAVYPLAEAREAQARMEAGAQFGKLVLRVRD